MLKRIVKKLTRVPSVAVRGIIEIFATKTV
jgi:hypothetical protein